MDLNKHDIKRFLVKSSDLTRKKLFVEFYQPKSQFLFKKLHECPYPLHSLKELSNRMFDGPFGSNRKVDMYQDNGIIPYIRVKDVLPSGIFLDELKYISQEKHNELIRSRVVPGNLLITIAGRLGTAAVFPESLKEGNITGHIVGLELSKEINPHYVATFINSQLGQFQAIRLGHRTTRPELNLSEVGEFVIPVPPRPVQDLIAQIMQDAYVVRHKKLAQAEYIDLHISDFVLERLRINYIEVENAKYFCISIKELLSSRFDIKYQSPKAKNALFLLDKSEYSIKSLGDLIEEIHYGASVKNDYADDGIPFIRIGNLKPNYLDVSDIVYFDESKRNLLGKAFVKPEDLLMSRSGSVGIVAVVTSEANGFAFGSFQIKFRLFKNSANPFFIAYFLNSKIGKALLEQQKTGSIQMNITIEGIKAIKVPLPAIEIQNQIVREADEQRTQATFLRNESEDTLLTAKARVERIILGEEDVT
ncbi:hypothetical protein NIES22_33380 [Calothrix brevissima NIES-22]|nr:hypothetical protein NIES22_33380 [Calothrix brevissima NIES-22]